jgi:hypothetical protein
MTKQPVRNVNCQLSYLTVLSLAKCVNMEHCWNDTGKVKPMRSKKDMSWCKSVHPLKSHKLASNRTRTSALRGRRPRAWTIAVPIGWKCIMLWTALVGRDTEQPLLGFLHCRVEWKWKRKRIFISRNCHPRNQIRPYLEGCVCREKVNVLLQRRRERKWFGRKWIFRDVF